MDKKIKANSSKLLVLALIFTIICTSISLGFLTIFTKSTQSQNTQIENEIQSNTVATLNSSDLVSTNWDSFANINEKARPIGKFPTTTGSNNRESVFIGGTPIGIVTKANKLVVAEFVDVVTIDGAYSPAMRAGIIKGDLIISVDGIQIDNLFQLNDIITNSIKEVVVIVLRSNEEHCFKVLPVEDLTQNCKKIGIKCKGELSGIGTLTFIKSDNRYGALGHFIADEYGYSEIYQKGNIYNTNIDGFIKGEEGKAGELKGSIDFSAPSIGTIDKNILTGIYGTIDEKLKLDRKCYEIASRDEIKVGKAQIYTTIEGKTPKFYDIEVVKKEKQEGLLDKSMVIRITDKTLLDATGGILQGMSGSPIIQNDKIIGAVTHVFINNPALGYGVYADWMIDN